MDNSGPSLFVNSASVRTLQFLAPMLAVVHKRSVPNNSASFTPLPKMTVSEMLQKNVFHGMCLLIIIVLVTIQLNIMVLFKH